MFVATQCIFSALFLANSNKSTVFLVSLTTVNTLFIAILQVFSWVGGAQPSTKFLELPNIWPALDLNTLSHWCSQPNLTFPKIGTTILSYFFYPLCFHISNAHLNIKKYVCKVTYICFLPHPYHEISSDPATDMLLVIK